VARGAQACSTVRARADRRAERGRRGALRHVAGAHDVQPVGARGRSHAATVHAITSLPGCTSPCWSTSPDGPNAQDEQAHHGDGRADAAYELSLKLADALERIADDQAWPRRIR
jgi:hypothetical protein